MKGIVVHLVLILSVLCANAQKERGYELSFETGYETGIGKITVNNSSERVDDIQIISMINGYRFNPNLFAGIGVTLYSTLRIPVYGQIKYNFNERNTSPFASLNVGYSFIESAASQKIESYGFIASTNIGLDFRKNHKTSFYVTMGLSFQQIEYYEQSDYHYYRPTDRVKKQKLYLFIPIKIGIRL